MFLLAKIFQSNVTVGNGKMRVTSPFDSVPETPTQNNCGLGTST
jgi:hypothetical protein